ncbi:MAG: diaminopimelate decarboxylase [Chthoniobacter sp.]|jgi:diaminopimelate decarboxylase|nr:diaminopimelate decarboxylase [Chthoniobacter sp.]
MHHDPALLRSLAAQTGTPFWLYDARTIRQRIGDVQFISDSPGVQARFAMKACPATKVLREMQAAGIWIDAVSGNEVLRALRAGHPAGNHPPVICLTCDVFRDNALAVVLEQGILPNIGSPGQIADLQRAGYRGPVSLRVNPGFGHGHVNACDTGGPSSKHGIWFEDLMTTKGAADAAGLEVTMLHAHIGSGPQFSELHENLTRLAAEFVAVLKKFPQLTAVSLGGGIPHNYKEHGAQVPVEPLRDLFNSCHQRLVSAARRELRLEIEPGRYYVAPGCTLVTRVTDVKRTRSNEKGSGATFAMVDAGFVDLVRPAMYGSYHQIDIVGRDDDEPYVPREPIVVAGPLCESGDIFTRDERELLAPRQLPRPAPGDLLTLADAGAYGYAMSSNYNSIGRAPQLWLEEDGSVELISRRETIDDLLRVETSERLA